MKSGVKEILPALQQVSLRHADIKILTGDYMAITQPDVPALLHSELRNAEIRMIESGGMAFHPKSYLFGSLTGDSVIVGSSNLSKSALRSGIEWNLHVPSSTDPNLFETTTQEFMNLFFSPLTRTVNTEQFSHYRERYNKMNAKLPFSREWAKQEEIDMTFGLPDETTPAVLERSHPYSSERLMPRPAQEIALRSLEYTIKERFDKGVGCSCDRSWKD